VIVEEHGELALRRHGSDFEVILNGVFLMSTDGGASERVLVQRALAEAADPRRMLLGGLGVGYSLRAALDDPRVERVTVVELHEPVIRWNGTHFAPFNGHALADRRVQVLRADVVDFEPDAPCGAVCLDVDNGPGWLAHERNARLYDAEGLARLRGWLAPGGVLAVWSAQAEPGFPERLAAVFGAAGVERVPVPRGDDFVYWAVR
jgi:spermidine synthase